MAPDYLTIGHYFTLQRGTTYKSRLLGEPGPVLLGLASIARNGGFRGDALKTYGGDSPSKLLVRPGELYVSLKDVTQSGDLLGSVARLPQSHVPGRLTQDTVKLEPRQRDAPLAFLYWVMRTPEYREFCRSRATGTTNLGLAREDFLAFPVPAPTPKRQAIASILGALDDKIELNRRMNQTLEEMAQAIFKSWFVDFDGHTEFEDSELGRIPKGWIRCPLGEALELKRGYDLPSTQRSPGPVPVCSSSGISGHHNEAKVRGPGVVTGRYGTIGQVFFIEEDFWPLNTTLYVRDFKRVVPRYALYLLRTLDFTAYTDKAAVPGINRNHLHQATIVLPPLDAQSAFRNAVEPLLLRAKRNVAENRTLTELRDTLLPKLISGEIRIPEAEKLVENVA